MKLPSTSVSRRSQLEELQARAEGDGRRRRWLKAGPGWEGTGEEAPPTKNGAGYQTMSELGGEEVHQTKTEEAEDADRGTSNKTGGPFTIRASKLLLLPPGGQQRVYRTRRF